MIGWTRRLLLVLAVLIAILLVGTACGPISSTTHLIDARDQFKIAKREEAKTYAPYEYTKAEIYLRKAKELQGYSEYQQSMVFAIRAKDMSVEAVKVSRKNKAKQQRLKLRKAPQKPGTVRRVISGQAAPGKAVSPKPKPKPVKKTIQVIGPRGAQ